MSAEMETDQVQNGTRTETNGSGDQPEIKKAKVTEVVGKDKTSKRLVTNHLELLSIISLQGKLKVILRSYRDFLFHRILAVKGRWLSSGVGKSVGNNVT